MTVWIWDASALHHAASADRLDVLLDMAKAGGDPPERSLTTATVAMELTRIGTWVKCEQYLDIVDLESFQELTVLTDWLGVVSGGQRNRGEATVFAWAEVHGGVVLVDDKDARDAASSRLTVHGTLWILVEAVKAGVPAVTADRLVETLRRDGARLPSFPAGGIVAWAQGKNLLQ